ncbi:MAG: esterase [Gammaproteobacteria bacterium RIFCSPLOWO2_02_FULL_52_10]|nr:MAG: esterase [Gammaproteobacteria bacterium RIFCSPLOWO2_02_FULL_52_10]
MSTFLVAHGAWSAGWAWKKMHPLMSGMGHRFITPTYTGLGERAHLAHAGIDLETHIQDILGVIKYEALTDIILIGHSYGGMVATGVVDRAGAVIKRLVYLDAFVPRDGQSLYDLVTDEARQRIRQFPATNDDNWRLPPNPMPADTPAQDRQWCEPLRRHQPVRTVTQPVRLRQDTPPIPRTYIYCTRSDTFQQFARRAQVEGWDYHEMDSSHNPHITLPEELAALLNEIAAM